MTTYQYLREACRRSACHKLHPLQILGARPPGQYQDHNPESVVVVQVKLHSINVSSPAQNLPINNI